MKDANVSFSLSSWGTPNRFIEQCGSEGMNWIGL
jgi:hypothetical protein